jgi:hypothetical protein
MIKPQRAELPDLSISRSLEEGSEEEAEGCTVYSQVTMKMRIWLTGLAKGIRASRFGVTVESGLDKINLPKIAKAK